MLRNHDLKSRTTTTKKERNSQIQDRVVAEDKFLVNFKKN